MKVRKTISLPEELAKWIYKQIEKRRYFNFSHAIEVAIAEKMEREGKEKKA